MNYMNIALEEAKKAFSEGNVPVGCVIVKNGEVIAYAHNTKNTSNISVNHAEILAIIEACKKLNTWRLIDCDLYVTLKPCGMCAAAIAESRINSVFYLLDSNYGENLNKNYNNVNYIKKNDSNRVYLEMIQMFFKSVR